MENDLFVQALQIWDKIVFKEEIEFGDLEKILRDKDAEFLHVGDFYYYLFNLKTISFDFISDNVVDILGYETEEMTIPLFISLLHPEDLPYFMLFEEEVVRFFNALNPDKIPKYKVRYDFRIRTKSGHYIRLLHQIIALVPDARSRLNQTLCYHTDISYLNKQGKPLLSFIGLQGEPSYVGVAGDVEFSKPFAHTLSKREMEIVKLLAEGSTSNQIARILHLSIHTVRTHRKNILKKLNLNNTVDLTALVLKEGWL